jgi:dTDP-4-dehydrorhamnose reductase
MKIAVTGQNGRLGSELVKHGCIPMGGDITSQFGIEISLKDLNPDVIINCAAKTNVDGCETDEGYKEALAVNYRGAVNLREVFHGYLIHISTDYVFDCKHGPYSEEDFNLHPVNSYGYSKFGAEAGLHMFPEYKTVVVRTTGLYGGFSGKSDFVSNVVKSLTRKEPIKVTDELYGNQTYIPHLAEALIKLAGYNDTEKSFEVIHIGSQEVVSRYQFALMVANIFELDKTLIIPCKNDDVPSWVAKRPTKGGLINTNAIKYGLPIYSIYNGLRDLKEKGLKYYEIRDSHSVL